MEGTEDTASAEAITRPAIDGLLGWLNRNGLEGYDPYDVLGHRALGMLHALGQGRSRPFRAPHRLANDYLLKHSAAGRRLLRIRPARNAKALGLLLQSYVRLAKQGDQDVEYKGSQIADALLAMGTREYGGLGWGYPFDWYTRVAIPSGTPSAVVTSTCGRALLEWADLTGDEQSREAAYSAAEFLACGLNRTAGEQGICLSYTPLDDFAVHNSNLMAASFILEVAGRTGADDQARLAESCLDFTLSEQREDGAFEYWAATQRVVSHIDNYHTGFVLRSLQEFVAGGIDRAAPSLRSGWRFYAEQLLPGADRARPLDSVGDDSRVNIHSAAESILCPAMLSELFPDAREIALRSVRWTLDNMLNDDGSFAYMWTPDHLDRTPYLRWGESWMLLALIVASSLEEAGC